jgi:hypothetical protein
MAKIVFDHNACQTCQAIFSRPIKIHSNSVSTKAHDLVEKPDPMKQNE